MIVNQKSHYYLQLFLDLLIVNAVFLISAALAQPFHILISRNYMFILMAVLNFLWYFTSNVNGFYEDNNLRSFSYQLNGILKNTFVQATAAVLFIFIAKEDLFTRNFILYYAVLLIVFVSIRIQLVQFVIKKFSLKSKKLQNIIIVGAGEVAHNFYNSTFKLKTFGYNFCGYLADDETSSNHKNKIIGRIENLEAIIISHNINEVVVALPIQEFKRLDHIIKICNRHAVRVHIIPDYFKYISKKFRVSMFESFPIITIRDEPLAEAHWRFIKRTFDILFSSLIIILFLSWLIPIIAVLIKLCTRDSVFFVQKRVGVKNKSFNFYKFKTLTSTEKDENASYSPVTVGDSRITSIGRILRRTNLDELPQFFNILKGDMSVVGPRPHFIPYNNVYSGIVDEIKLRNRVRPGLTGWAQVHGLRGDSPNPVENEIRTKKRIEYDIWYIENWSIWLDFQIIGLTIWQMIRGETRAI
ncbi:MAG: exopolysaccharide biosynthesis polyprenyl glycosylphosphotransferase [Ignavibacteriaceae bacterium]|nr:exopolysaccharide biosynthesis polyprenyl glycosylphosphotransferase [Ignavibacteriaceae bacterium]